MIAMFICQVAFGGYGVVYQMYSRHLDPVLLCMIRDCGAFPLLLILSLCLEGPLCPPRGDIAFIGVMGADLFVSQACFVAAVQMLGPSLTAIAQPLIPIITTLLSFLFRFESLCPLSRFTLAKVFGVCVGCAGAFTIVISAHLKHSGGLEPATINGTMHNATMGAVEVPRWLQSDSYVRTLHL